MKEKVFNNIKNNNLIAKNSLVAVGVSGGVDSVVLLHVLTKLKDELGFKLFAIHINHNIRGSEAKRDQDFVKKYCKILGVECVCRDVYALQYAKENKKTIEQSARELRFAEFDKVMNEKNSYCLAVAHNADDQAETILMHLFRGAGVDGLIGMEFKSRNIIRPLLNISRKEIEEYAKRNNLTHITDSTNLENKYARNKIRNEIIPMIEELYPSMKSNICSFSGKLNEVKQLIDEKISLDKIKTNKNKIILLNETKLLDNTEQKLLIKQCFNRINGCVDIEEKHILMVKELFDLQVGKKLDFPNGIKVSRIRTGLEFYVDKAFEFKPISYNEGACKIETSIGTIYVEFVKIATYGDGNLYVDGDKIPSGAIWRKLERGDKFTKFGGGTKLVSDFLTDKKIELNSRKDMVVLAKDKQVLVIPGVEIANELKIDSNTKKVVKITCLN